MENSQQKYREIETECRKLKEENEKLKEKPMEVSVEAGETGNKEVLTQNKEEKKVCTWIHNNGSQCSYEAKTTDELEQHLKSQKEKKYEM